MNVDARSTGRAAGRLRSPTIVRASGLVVSIAYASLVVWAYVHQPQTIAEVQGGLTASVGVYAVDQAALDEALQFFRNDQFREARQLRLQE